MEKETDKKTEVRDYTPEYNEIVRNSDNSVVIELQWEEEGDYFEKLSIYDNTYVPVPTLGQTTLINNY